MRIKNLPKALMIAAVTVALLLILLAGCNEFWGPVGPSIRYDSLTDSRDGQSYRTVKIGKQIWMAENLNYSASGSVCYDNNSSNCNTYGRLYDWATVMGLPSNCNSSFCGNQIQTKHQGICPSGWHIPSDAEWTQLMNYAGKSASPISSELPIPRLKSRSGWNNNRNGTDNYGFSALPGGGRWGGEFSGVGDRAVWWSATDFADCCAWVRDAAFYVDNGSRVAYYKTNMYSLRCVKN